MARDRGGPRLSLQLLEVPVTDLGDGEHDYPSVALFGEGYGLDRVDMDVYAESYLASPADGSDSYASPLRAVDLGGVVPAHVLTAEYDILRDSGEAYARRLEDAGVETTLSRRLGHTHGSSALWQWWEPARQWINEVVGALQSALHPAAAETR
jgi:acetyl esterase